MASELPGEITLGEILAALREIACAAPAFDGKRFEDYPSFAGRLRLTASDAVAKFDAAVAAEAARRFPAEDK